MKLKWPGDEPYRPDLSGSWYLPLTTIWRAIRAIFGHRDYQPIKTEEKKQNENRL